MSEMNVTFEVSRVEWVSQLISENVTLERYSTDKEKGKKLENDSVWWGFICNVTHFVGLGSPPMGLSLAYF